MKTQLNIWDEEIRNVAISYRKEIGACLDEEIVAKFVRLISVALDWCSDNNAYPENRINQVREILPRIQYGLYDDEGCIYVTSSKRGWYDSFTQLMEEDWA